MISQRTKEALARKRAEGILLGRPLGRKSSHNKLTGKEKEIKNLCEHKIGFSAMGRILGVNRMTVAKYCSDNNLITKKTSKNPQSISKLELIKKGELVKLVKAGKTKKEIAALSGVSFSSAVNYIDRNPELRELYENVQDKIRIKKNGGLHINKRHMGN
jgi:DNA invertase Pin-like site-specific DNA recombinase